MFIIYLQLQYTNIKTTGVYKNASPISRTQWTIHCRFLFNKPQASPSPKFHNCDSRKFEATSRDFLVLQIDVIVARLQWQ